MIHGDMSTSRASGLEFVSRTNSSVTLTIRVEVGYETGLVRGRASGMHKRTWLTALIAPLAMMSIQFSSWAASAGVLLDSLELEETDSDWTLQIQLASPVRYLRHAPPEKGRILEIAIEPIAVAPGQTGSWLDGETLRLPSSSTLPLEDVRIVVPTGESPLVLLLFRRELRYQLQLGKDFRSIVVRISKPEHLPRGSTSADGSTRTAEIMAEARQAMVAKDYDRAIALYTLVLQAHSAEPSLFAPEALEYLGLARQNNGQLAHARAEYEAYLAGFPDGEGAERVQQRLMALDTARADPPEPMRAAERRSRTDIDYYGTLYTSYFRTESYADLSGAELVDSSQLLDADLGIRLRHGSFELGGRAAGYLRYDIEEGGSEVPSRVTRLFVEARDHGRHLGGILGRQRSKGAGVLGRFDGFWGDWTFVDGWTLEAVAGFPLLSSVNNRVNTDAQVYGLGLESDELIPGLSAELYGVGQFVDGVTDRASIGMELRYANDRVSAFSVVDYDVYFLELNLATLSGAWRISSATTLNAVLDYRYSPFVTSRNALRGQPVKDLDDLQDLFSNSEIADLARDRTPRVTTLVAGASHRFTDRLDLNGDFTATKLGSTVGSGGVPGYPASDWEFRYYAQLIAWDWLVQGGSERLGLRYFDGWRYDAVSMTMSGRYVAFNDLRFTPSLRFDYRMNEGTQDFIELDPGIRFEYRFYGFIFDTDFVFQWIQGVGSTGGAPRRDEFGYVLNVGLRYDF
jgi:hypothetical protein